MPDLLRANSVESLISTKTFQNCWLTWQKEIHRHLGHDFTENEVINLGDHLSDIFRSTGGEGRGHG